VDDDRSINASSLVSCEDKIAIVEFPRLDAFQEASIGVEMKNNHNPMQGTEQAEWHSVD
jgi:hypothetical protein